MKKVISFIINTDHYILFPIISLVITIFLSVGTFLIFYNHLPSKLPLFYSLPWGQTQLAAKEQFLLLPAILIFINLANIFLSSQLHSIQTVLKRTLLLSLILINLIILITSLKIIFIFV